MEEYNHLFGCGVEMRIVKGEDGYTVDIGGSSYAPLTGTFTDFKKMLHGIKDAVQSYSDTRTEIECIAIDLEFNFDIDMDSDEIEQILLNYD